MLLPLAAPREPRASPISFYRFIGKAAPVELNSSGAVLFSSPYLSRAKRNSTAPAAVIWTVILILISICRLHGVRFRAIWGGDYKMCPRRQFVKRRGICVRPHDSAAIRPAYDLQHQGARQLQQVGGQPGKTEGPGEIPALEFSASDGYRYRRRVRHVRHPHR